MQTNEFNLIFFKKFPAPMAEQPIRSIGVVTWSAKGWGSPITEQMNEFVSFHFR